METKFIEGRLPSPAGSKSIRVEFNERIVSITDIETASELPILSLGLIDTHMHGLDGFSVSAKADDLVSITEAAARYGVTRTIVSLVSSPLDEMIAVLQAASGVPQSSGLIGVHLEGPYLSESRCGAHAIGELRPAADSELEKVLQFDSLSSITIAPEQVTLEQTVGLAKRVLVAIGHTDADYELSLKYFGAGARILTHALNAMPRFESRSPGPLGAAIKADAYVEIIADGNHLHPATVVGLFAMTNKAILVTDSIAAAGLGDIELELGGVGVKVQSGVARRTDNQALAGSTLTLNQAVKNCVSWGLAEDVALAAASTRPANAYGLKNHQIKVGGTADLVLWDEFEPLEVYRDGRLIHGSTVN